MTAVPLASRPRQVQLAISLAVFMVPFTGSAMNLALPQLAGDLSLNAIGLTLVVSAYLVAAAMFQVPAARLADLYGRRRIFLSGLALFGAASLLCGVAWSGTALVALRFVTGIGSAMVFSTNMAILSAVFPPSERGRAFGVNTAVVYAAASLGPVLGGLLAHYAGWRSIFFVCAALAVASFGAGRRAIRDEWAAAKGEPFDFPGSVLYAVSLTGVIAGCSLLPGMWGWIFLGVGAVFTPLFARLARRKAFPVMNLELFYSRREFRLAALSAMINYAASFAIGFLVGLYLQFVRGLPPGQVGFILMAQPLTQTLLSPLAGRWSDRIDPSILTTAGMAVIAVGVAGLGYLGMETPIAGLVALLMVIGVGFGLFSSPNVNLIMGSVESRHHSLASATTGTVRLIGQAMSMAIATMAIHFHLGTEAISTENGRRLMPSLRLAFFVFAVLCLVGVYTSAVKLIRRRPPGAADGHAPCPTGKIP